MESTSSWFAILILVHYGGWIAHSEDRESMQLNATKNDMKCLLDHLKYRHDDTTRKWYILSDFDCMYRDAAGVEQPLKRHGLPNREIILKTVEEATKSCSSGLIFYGGHCHYRAPGKSKLEQQDGLTVFIETEDSRRGKKAAYLVCCDGARIYGTEFFACLPKSPKNGGPSTLTLVFDTCEAAGFTADFPGLSFTYDSESLSTIKAPTAFSRPSLGQLIVVTASRLHENAWSYSNHGALTFFMTEYLQKCPDASAAKLVQYLDARCATQPNPYRRQHPQIRSRYPLNGPFSLLPERF